MECRTLAALRGSIEKWRGIADGIQEDLGTANCPLCKIFYEDTCTGCPVSELTGRVGCDGSPYEIVGAMSDCDDGYKEAALEELDFLVSLLPKDER